MTAQRYIATSNLDATLERRERSRRWLARKIGVSPSLLNFAVKGERTISADKALRAAAVLDESIEYLFMLATPRNETDTLEHVA